ncbi:MAG TPA: hypothetical protein VLA58_01955, partial [Chitinophagaceae bacterium]|nr:hypothetical protein [Chitinophagaceae bacterium]
MNPSSQPQAAPVSTSTSGMRKRIGIFGSTGSIGKQALDVIEANPDKFTVAILTAHSNHELLIEQATRHKPACVVIVDEGKFNEVKKTLT